MGVKTTAQKQHPTPSKTVRQLLASNPDAAFALPDPRLRHVRFDAVKSGISDSLWKRLRHYDIVEVTERTFPSSDDQEQWSWYRTDPNVHRWIHETLTEPTTAPCGHTGVSCIERGTTFTCKRDDCETTFGPETAKELMNT